MADITIKLDGGIVQGVMCNKSMTYCVIDYDTEGAEPAELSYDEQGEPCVVGDTSDVIVHDPVYQQPYEAVLDYLTIILAATGNMHQLPHILADTRVVGALAEALVPAKHRTNPSWQALVRKTLAPYIGPEGI